jgi:hypothetical protein
VGNPGIAVANAPVVQMDTQPPGNVSFNTPQGASQGADAAFFNRNDSVAVTAKAIAPRINKPSDTDITSITVKVSGADLSTDSLVFGSITQALSSSNGGSNITINGVTGITWNYNASSSILTLQKTVAGVLSADNVNAIELDLRFKSSASTTQGARTFTFTHADAAGNISGVGTQTLNVDTVVLPSDWNSVTTGVQTSDTSFFNIANMATSKNILPALAVPVAENDIVSISVTANYGLIAVGDQLAFGSVAQSIIVSTPANGTTTISGISVDWAMSINKFLVITKTGGGTFTAIEVNTIQADLRFLTTSTAQTLRLIGIGRTDSAGNTSPYSTISFTVDTVAPIDIDLNGATPTTTDKTLSRNFAIKEISTGLLMAPNVFIPTVQQTDIARIRVAMGGGIDSTSDILAIGANAFFLIGVKQTSSNVTIANVLGTVELVLEADNALTITKTGGGSFTSTEAGNIERLLQFKTTSTSSANRTATISQTDQAGNKTADSVVTISVDTVAPLSPDLIASTQAIDTTVSANFKFDSRISTAQPYVVLIAPNMAVPTDVDIARIQIVATGFQNDVDALFLGGITVVFRSTSTSSGYGFSAIPLLIAQTNGTFTFSKQVGSPVFLPSEIQLILQSLSYRLATGVNAATVNQGTRTFAISYIDAFGNAGPSVTASIVVDTLAPQNIDLRSDIATTQTTDTNYFNKADYTQGVKAIAPNIAATTDNDISMIQLQVSTLAPATYKLRLGSFDQPIGTAQPNGSTTFNGISLVWSYDANRLLSISKAGGAAFTTDELFSIEQGLSLVTDNAANPAQSSYTFQLKHIDAFGNIGNVSIETVTFDTITPVVNIANTLTLTSNASSAITLFKNTATVTEATALQNVQIKVKNLRDGSLEKLTVNGTEIDATGSAASNGSVSLTGATWNWNYNSLGAFTFTLSSGNPTATMAAALLQTVGYKNAAGSAATDDTRQFVVTTTDLAGNTSAESAVNVVIDARKPTAATLNPVVVFDANNDGIKGDQFVISFSEAVKVTNITPVTAWTVSLGSLGPGAIITAIDAMTINGVDYATNYWVRTGTSPLLSPGSKALVLDQANQQYVKLPNVEFGSDMTLEAWINPQMATFNYNRIFDFGNATANLSNFNAVDDVWLGYNRTNKTLQLQAFNGSTLIGTSVTVTEIPSNQWTHIAATVDLNRNVVLYFNGVAQPIVSGVIPTDTATSSATWVAAKTTTVYTINSIGKSNWANDSYFKGMIFDARVYDDARTAAEIASDMAGNIDTSDTQLKVAYSLDGTYASSVAGASAGQGITTTGTVAFSATNNTTMSIANTSVVDTNNSTAVLAQTFTITKTSGVGQSGTAASETLVGDANNNFLAGQGGSDTLTGGAGADTFAWLLGETGSDRVNDFKASEGDMINLSGLLQTAGMGPNTPATKLSQYMQLAQSATTISDAVLTIDPTGASNFLATNTSLKTITFTNGWSAGGLNDTLSNLVSKKVINLNYLSATPLMLDLNGDGVHTTSVDEGVIFDIQGNGQPVTTAWSDGKDGFLALDVNHDGVINSGLELFGNGTVLPNGTKAQDGFEALSTYDGNQDGVIDASDTIFANLRVWIDTNHNGISEQTELLTLDNIGVKNIQLHATASQSVDNGNPLSLVSHWTDISGQQHAVADVLLTTSTQLKHDVVI